MKGDDAAWFAARPWRQYRQRPTRLADLPPGAAMRPSFHTVVLKNPNLPVTVGPRPNRLRYDNDRVCRALVHRSGYRVNGWRVEDIRILGGPHG